MQGKRKLRPPITTTKRATQQTMSSSDSTKDTSKPAMTTTPYYTKRLEGINANAVLLELWKDAYSKNVDGASAGEGSSDHAEAIEILRNAGDPRSIKKTTATTKTKPTTTIMPLKVIRSIRFLSPTASAIESLDRALNDPSVGLAFTPPPPEKEITPERKKYLERMEKLLLKSEETKYTRITNNIKDQRQEDDKTAKSMTYAASVGLNMIVAPISFGAFMYFFSGGVFDFFFPPGEDDDFANKNPTGVDIKRLIVAVVSGVIMMIIEMVLFVIRSHEFEAHTTKKKKKRGVQPFGSYSANSAMTYSDGSGSSSSSKQRSTSELPQQDLAVKKTN